jgi:hypothetical protein
MKLQMYDCKVDVVSDFAKATRVVVAVVMLRISL